LEAGYGDNPQFRCRTLYYYLKEEPPCLEIIRQLPPNAVGAEIPIESVPGEYTGEFFDSYGKVMDWHPTGGSANTPVLISAGPDGDFGHTVSGTNEVAVGPYTEDQIEAQKDNIRSDGRTQSP
ncbi:MAG: hypothetical protein ACYTFO_11015, partial [Planctomycetota bacterium]